MWGNIIIVFTQLRTLTAESCAVQPLSDLLATAQIYWSSWGKHRLGYKLAPLTFKSPLTLIMMVFCIKQPAL